MGEVSGDARLPKRLLVASGVGSALLLAWNTAADVGAGDSGEIGGAACALGVAHPTGFPLDMLLLRAFALLPLGPLAWRENLAVACVGACGVAALTLLSCRLSERAGIGSSRARAIGAAVAGCGLLGFRTFLAAVLGVEVYASTVALLAIGALLALPVRAQPIGALFGLTLGAHVVAPFTSLPLLAATALRDLLPGSRRRRRFVAGVIAGAASALVLSYLPLASLRDTAFDWGDPETLPRLLRHLSAARIREAYQHDMFTARGTPGLALFGQLAERAWLLPPAVWGFIALARAERSIALVLAAVLSLDLAYAVWINPMGIAQHQLGHVSGAVLALAAGVGVAAAIQRARRLATPVALLGVALCAVLLAGAAWPERSDGYAVAERFGASSAITALPPRAIVLCSSDSGCASALFARYVEGARPDIAIAPAQHLWDPSVRRRLERTGQPTLQLAAASPSLRAGQAREALLTLLAAGEERPVFVESWPDAQRAADLRHVPWLGVSASAAPRLESDGAERRLAALERAQFGPAGPQTSTARELWASAYEELGKAHLKLGAADAALQAFQRTLELTPERAVAHSNLGVALEQQGDLAGALRETRAALELDPDRATAWLNLARLMLRTTGREAALSVLSTAESNAVHDPRLSDLRQSLGASAAAEQ